MAETIFLWYNTEEIDSEVFSLIKLVNVSKYYSANNVIALGLRKANIELHVNEFVAIVGESGSGKTTLLNVICGIDSYEEGEMYINGEETSYFSTSEMENYRKKYVAFVFQNYNLIDSYTVLQNVEAPLILAGYPKKDIRKRALEIIDRVGLSKHVRHKATKLSGGQKQRVVIARALAKDCPIIAADEPTGNLDSESGKQILELLHEISKEKLVILVTHDFDQVKPFATRKIRIYDGEIVEDIVLKKVEKQNLPAIEDATVKVRFLDLLKMAGNNLLAVPKKTILLMMVLLISTFFVAWMFGTFSRINSQAESTGMYYNQFVNISPNRVVVRKADTSAFTPEELTSLNNMIGVEHLISFDYAMDTVLEMRISEDGVLVSNFMTGIVPLKLVEDQTSFLKYGELPDSDDEIAVILSSTYEESAELFLGTTIDNKNFYKDRIIAGTADFTVTGVFLMEDLNMMASNSSFQNTDMFFVVSETVFEEYREDLYFNTITETLLDGTNNLSDDVIVDANIFTSNRYYGSSASIIIDDAIIDNRIEISSWDGSVLYQMCPFGQETCTVTGTFSYSDFYQTREIDNFTIYAEYVEYGNPEIKMNSATYSSFLYPDVYQVSLIGDANKILFNLPFLGLGKYQTTYPYEQSRITTGIEDIYYFLSNLLASGLALFFVVLVTMLVTYLVTRLVYNTKLRDYAIFRTIGANQGIIRWFIYLENIFMTTGTYLIFLPLAIYLKLTQGRESPLWGFSFYNFGSFVVLFLILLAIAFFNSRKYCRKIFKESVNKTLKNVE